MKMVACFTANKLYQFAGVAVLTLHEALYSDPRRDYWVVLEDTERPIRMAGSQIEEIAA